ncbi:MAG: pilus assembly protein PilM [Gammaproteobacteria bacterium]
MLAFLQKHKTIAGLTAVSLEQNGIAICRIVRGPERRAELRQQTGVERRPVLSLCEFYPYAKEVDLTEALMRLGRVHQLDIARCTTLLDREDYKLLLTKAPQVEEAELAAALRWQIKDLIDCPADDITLDVFDVQEDAHPSQAREVFVVTARNDTIQHRVDLFSEAQVDLRIIDIPELAQRNIAALLPEDQQGVALLWLHAHGGLITLTRNGTLHLSRNLKAGTGALQGTALDTQALETIILEIQRSLDYYESHYHLPPIQQLVLAPCSESATELMTMMVEQLGIQTRQLDLEQILQIKTKTPEDWQQTHYLAIGAALRQELREI